MSAVTPLRVSTLCDDSAASTVTVLVAAAKPRRTCNGSHGLASSRSGKHPLNLPNQPCVAWSSTPGSAPMQLRRIMRTARPIDELARLPGPNRLPGAVHAELVADRAVDDDDGRGPAGAAHRDVGAEVGVVHRAEHRADDGEMLGEATGEHAVHDDGTGGHLDAAHRLAEQHVVRRPAARVGEARDQRFRGRDDGQPVGPALRVTPLDRVGVVVDGDVEHLHHVTGYDRLT